MTLGKVLAAALLLLVAQLGAAGLATTATYWPPAVTSAPPLVVSEMGWGIGPTENTLAAFAAGLKLGASGVEVTSRRTLDGRVALIHNAVATNGRPVMKSNFSQLPSGTLDLAQYLAFVKPHGMNIMMQNNLGEPGYDPENRVADLVVALVRKAQLADKVLLSAFNLATVSRAKKVSVGTDIRVAWLTVSWQTARKMGVPPALAPVMNSTQYLDKVAGAGLDAINPEALVLADGTLLAEAFARHIQVYVWWLGINTSSEENLADMVVMSECGVGGFITPRVQMAIQASKSRVFPPRSGGTECRTSA
jgi:glycerophosphoryl diester phosphodiesterase